MTMSSTTSWDDLAALARDAVSDADVDAARRTLDYLCVAQLYLGSNPRLARDLRLADLKASPRGHWGVCPSVNSVLAVLGPLNGVTGDRAEVTVLHGAGHANASALAHSYLTGALGQDDPAFAWSRSALQRLVEGFPDVERFGGEITPLLPDQAYMGGQLGLALPVAQGMALDEPRRLVVPLIGDGECETGTTAAAWLGARALTCTGEHGAVLPVVLLNGQRMGGASLLAGLSDPELTGYFAGVGYTAVTTDARDTGDLRDALTDCLSQLRPLEDGPSVVLVVRLSKGYGAPVEVAGRQIMGTPLVHKTPLRSPADDPEEYEVLERWLHSYRPAELLGEDGVPALPVRRALGERPTRLTASRTFRSPDPCHVSRQHSVEFGPTVSATLRGLHSRTGLRVFSPDELHSNRIDAGGNAGQPPSWVVEVLSEELCHAWAQGCIETRRPAVVISYEGFAPVVTSALVQHLKSQSVARAAGRQPAPGLVYLLTSLGWDNTHSHANPGLVVSAIATADPTVRVLTPADSARTAAALAAAVEEAGTCSLITKGKHLTSTWPTTTLAAELEHGCAIWPHLSDPGSCDLVLAAAGDLAGDQLAFAAQRLRHQRPAARLRFVTIHDLTCLGTPGRWPRGLSDERFTATFGTRAPVLLATVCAREAPALLLTDRPARARFHLRGYRDPGRPMSPAALLRACRMDAHSLTEDAITLLDSGENRRTA